MTRMLKRQLNDDEKAEILRRYGRKCFATGHEIPEGEEIQFDHIRAYATGGPTELDNIAPMCARHNREKSTLPLDEFRVKLMLDDFFKSGDKLTLKHLLEFLKDRKDISSYGEPVAIAEDGESITVESAGRKYAQAMCSCPTTGWKYFYATLHVEVLDSDDDEDQRMGLQPRYLIQSKVFDMFRHFQTHPVLQPSIGRVVGNYIRLFDGQHKAAALLLTSRREFECKVYLAPDLRLLNQTNISAHDKFAQTRFFSSIMVLKLGSQFGSDFEEYKNLEDGQAKSESGFMEYLARRDPLQTRGQRNTKFRSYLYSSVLEHDENRLSSLVSSSNRSSAEKPITMDMLQKSLFSGFLYREPVDDNMATLAYKRDIEVENTVCLMNMFYDLALTDWNPKAGPNDPSQRRLDRMFRSKSMMAWSELLHGAVCGKLDLQDGEEREMPFYRELRQEDMERVKSVVTRLVQWSRWQAPGGDEIERVLSDNKRAVKEWFRNHGLTTGYLMGASE